jgi:hypothetical protein
MAALEQHEQEGEQPTSLPVEAFHIVLEMPLTLPNLQAQLVKWFHSEAKQVLIRTLTIPGGYQYHVSQHITIPQKLLVIVHSSTRKECQQC